MGKIFTLVFLCFIGFGVFAGFSACITFMLFYSNYHAAVWGFVSGAVAAVNFHVVYLNYCEILDSWHSVHTLRDINSFGFVALLTGTTGTVWYLFKVFYLDLPLFPIDDSIQIAIIWTFMTAKWGATLYFITNRYMKQLQETSPSLLNGFRR